jgi:sarcosine oxidase subunit beta
MPDYDSIIIGAGVIGSAIAFELAKRGHRTLNIDKLPAAGYGSTSNSCAIIRVHYSTLDGTALAYDSYFYWKRWRDYLGVDDERGLAVFHDTGALILKTEQNGHLEKVARLVASLDIPHEHWDADHIRERLPIYDLHRFGPPRPLDDEAFGQPSGGEIGGGIFFPTAGYINDPQLASHNLQRAAEAVGATFLFNRKVVEIPRAGGRVAGVVLDDGTRIEAPLLINVAGPHSNVINRMAGVDDDMKITTRALRQEVVHVPSPAGFDFEKAGFVVSDSDIGCYVRPETGNHILVGSEDPECDEREWVDPDHYDRDFSDQWTTQAYRLAQRVPNLGIPSRKRGCVDLYDVTADWLPIYDRSSLPGYYMAIGTSGNQFKNAPVVGMLMSELIEYCEAGNDHDAVPYHYRLNNVDHELDLKSFSRLREINPDSSFSVLG